MAGRKAGWDTELGYRLYLEGKTNQEIAEACGTSLANVKAARRNHWKKGPGCPPGGSIVEIAAPVCALARNDVKDLRKEVAGVHVEQKDKLDTARMMEVIAKMTSGMGGIKAVCVGNIVQALWNLNSIDDIRDARAILDWLEENYDFG